MFCASSGSKRQLVYLSPLHPRGGSHHPSCSWLDRLQIEPAGQIGLRPETMFLSPHLWGFLGLVLGLELPPLSCLLYPHYSEQVLCTLAFALLLLPWVPLHLLFTSSFLPLPPSFLPFIHAECDQNKKESRVSVMSSQTIVKVVCVRGLSLQLSSRSSALVWLPSLPSSFGFL